MGQTTAERIEQLRTRLEDYDVKIGLGQLISNNEVNRYLNMKHADLKKLPTGECAEAAVLLSQQAMHVQLETNKHLATVKYCERLINETIASTVDQCGGRYTPFEYRRHLAISQNESASELCEILIKEQSRVDAMAFIANALRNLSSTFETLHQSKRSIRI